MNTPSSLESCNYYGSCMKLNGNAYPQFIGGKRLKGATKSSVLMADRLIVLVRLTRWLSKNEKSKETRSPINFLYLSLSTYCSQKSPSKPKPNRACLSSMKLHVRVPWRPNIRNFIGPLEDSPGRH